MSAFDLAGELGLRLAWADGRIRSAAISQTRPLAAAQLLRGKTPAAAQALLPALFALCAQGQGAAAALALASAAGTPPSEEELGRWRARVVAEAIAETFWRLLIDAPAALGLAPAPAAVAQARALAQAAIRAQQIAAAGRAGFAALAAAQVLGEAPAEFLARRSAGDFDAWLASADTVPAATLRALEELAPRLGDARLAPLPPLSNQLLGALAAQPEPGFAAQPRWDGEPAETGALAREADHPMIAALLARDGAIARTRFAARLLELARLCNVGAGADWQLALRLPDGRGAAGVQTARGLLLHLARLEGGRIADYAIVAPTEWNFADPGPLARGLVDQPATSPAAAQQVARVWVQALDPCVGCQIEVFHA